MTVERVYVGGQLQAAAELPPVVRREAADGSSLPGQDPLALLLYAMALCNDARLEASGSVIGDPTETALFELAQEKGCLQERLDEKCPRVAEIPCWSCSASSA